MEIDTVIATVAAWLDRVDLEVARTRTDEIAREYGTAKSTALSTAPASARTLRRAAFHEASHAVVAIAHDVRVRRVVLHASGGGAVEMDDPEVLASALSQLAAPMLELLGGADERRQCELACGFDVMAARRALAAHPEVSHRAAATMAATLVLSRLAQIQRVAAALLALGELSGAEVRALCAHELQ